MAAPKSTTPQQREAHLTKVAELYLQGRYQHEIAAALGVVQQQISYDLKVLQKRWMAASLASIDEHKARELARLDELERTYWASWQRSRTAKETTTTKKAESGGTGRLEAGVRKEERDGNPAFLAGVERCIELRCKLMGIVDEKNVFNFLIHPDWLGLKAAILAALEEHPLALESVSRAIAERSGA